MKKKAVTNPYTMRGMLPIESDMFFGREREMRRIEDMLTGDSPQCVSIIGERRIGKSSLAFRVFHKMKELKDTIAVYLDCDGLSEKCKTKDQFFQLLNQLFLETPGNGPKLENLSMGVEGDLFDTYSSFKAFLKRAGGKKIKTVIFFDEFEHLPDKTFKDDTFYSNLRAVANNPDNRSAFVAVSKIRLKDLAHQSIQSSGFWNIFKTETVGLSDHPGIERLRGYGFEKTGLSLSDAEKEKIHYYAGDFPFFNQVVCGFVWDSNQYDDEPDWDRLEVEIFPFYEKVWEDRTKEEQKLLDGLKGKKDDFALKGMKARGILIKRNDRYFLFSDYLSYLIEEQLEIKRKKLSEKEIMKDIKDVMGLVKDGKEIITGKGE